MNRDLVDLLACPYCRSPLKLEVRSALREEVDAGTLGCPDCNRDFPITNGVARFLGDANGETDRTSAHFALEFSADAIDDLDIDPDDLIAFIFLSRTGLDVNAFRYGQRDWYPTASPDGYSPDWANLTGKVILEGGCGPARFLPVLAPHCKRVIGLEFGPHVDRAAQRCRGHRNVDVVQGSVFRPPFRPGAFDLVYSLGVLHHTESPAEGAHALGSLVAPEGQIALWVYGPDYWGRGVRRVTGKAIHSALSRMDPPDAYRAAKRWLFPLGEVQARLAKRKWTKLAGAPLFAVSVPRHPVPEIMMATIFDYFGAPIISTHDASEVCDWLADAGFENVEPLPVPTSVRATRGL